MNKKSFEQNHQSDIQNKKSTNLAMAQELFENYYPSHPHIRRLKYYLPPTFSEKI